MDTTTTCDAVFIYCKNGSGKKIVFTKPDSGLPNLKIEFSKLADDPWGKRVDVDFYIIDEKGAIKEYIGKIPVGIQMLPEERGSDYAHDPKTLTFINWGEETGIETHGFYIGIQALLDGEVDIVLIRWIEGMPNFNFQNPQSGVQAMSYQLLKELHQMGEGNSWQAELLTNMSS